MLLVSDLFCSHWVLGVIMSMFWAHQSLCQPSTNTFIHFVNCVITAVKRFNIVPIYSNSSLSTVLICHLCIRNVRICHSWTLEKETFYLLFLCMPNSLLNDFLRITHALCVGRTSFLGHSWVKWSTVQNSWWS